MIPLFWIPLVCFLGALWIGLAPSRNERLQHQIALGTGTLFLGLTLAEVGLWLVGRTLPFSEPIFHWDNYRFEFTLMMDLTAAVFLVVTAVLGGLVTRFSQYYMHREAGQRRFFGTLLLFLCGMSVVEMAADIDTLFMGWELVGISSFLLIGFYRHREQPVRNALKVYSIYRLCDVGLLLGAYAEHHEYGTSSFLLVASHPLPSHVALPIALLLLLSAAGKSAQFPFSFWVARAMEGPTPSSAIFYGALSIHVGVFLLLRTMPIWIVSDTARLLIFGCGFVTAVLATLIGHVQSNIKARIGYASVAQVGLMFCELALGLDHWILLHFVGNASLRCYQLLVSPSVVAYLLRLQSSVGPGRDSFFRFTFENYLPRRLRTTLYVIASQEAYMEVAVNRLVFGFPQWAARNIYGENKTILTVWNRCLVVSLILVAAVSWGVESFHPAIPFMASIVACYAIGLSGILLLPPEVRNEPLDHLHGMAANYPVSARLMFTSFLGMSGFPISPAFFGEDLLMAACMHVGIPLALFFSAAFLINGIVLARTFTRFFLGPPKRDIQLFSPDIPPSRPLAADVSLVALTGSGL